MDKDHELKQLDFSRNTSQYVKRSFGEEDFVDAKSSNPSTRVQMEKNKELSAALEYIISKSDNVGLNKDIIGLLEDQQKYDPIELSGIFFNNSPVKQKAEQDTPRFQDVSTEKKNNISPQKYLRGQPGMLESMKLQYESSSPRKSSQKKKKHGCPLSPSPTKPSPPKKLKMQEGGEFQLQIQHVFPKIEAKTVADEQNNIDLSNILFDCDDNEAENKETPKTDFDHKVGLGIEMDDEFISPIESPMGQTNFGFSRTFIETDNQGLEMN